MVEFSIVECTGKPMETPSKNRKMVSYIDTPFFDLFFAEEMASFPWVHSRFGKPKRSENFRPFSDARHSGVGKPQRRNRNPPFAQLQCPALGQSPVPFRIPPCRENGSLSRNVFSNGTGPNPQFHQAC